MSQIIEIIDNADYIQASMQQCPEYEQDAMNSILSIFTIRKNMFNMQQKVVFIWAHLLTFI